MPPRPGSQKEQSAPPESEAGAQPEGQPEGQAGGQPKGVPPWLGEAAAAAGVHPLRLHALSRLAGREEPPAAGAPVLYWVQNAQRAGDNPALDLATALAGGTGAGVVALFVLDGTVPYASERTFSFLLDGLAALGPALGERRVPFAVRTGSPAEEVVRAAVEVGAGAVVTDLSALRRGRHLRRAVGEALAGVGVPAVAVDTEHVVPLKALPNEQWAAYTIRPRLWRWLGLRPPDREGEEVPGLPALPEGVVSRQPGPALEGLSLAREGRRGLLEGLGVDGTVPPVADLPGGEGPALERLRAFVGERLAGYGGDRTRSRAAELTGDRTSRLSAYLRYGHVSPWRVAYEIATAPGPAADRNSFLEELLVRRELSANFCWTNPHYRSLRGLPRWARETLRAHAADERPHGYTTTEFERAETHDPLWNAAQRQLLREGRIHNYVRIYWGKMILAWSRSPADALRTALRLNDRYALDGRSPNGCTNILWCFGKHDRPWFERPVFGTVRYMTAEGVARKFRVGPYLEAFAP